MPVTRESLNLALAEVNAGAPQGKEARVVDFDPGRFTVRFRERRLPEGKCVDELFTEVQFILHERAKVDTNLLGVEPSEDGDEYLVHYEVVEW